MIASKSSVCKIDTAFGKDPGFVYYDFNKHEELSKDLHGYFDMVVIDPPFITREVWEKYAECAKMLLRNDGKGMYLISTIDENKAMIEELTGSKPQIFRPSIPNLVYQYSFYANYENPAMNEKNPEIPDFD